MAKTFHKFPSIGKFSDLIKSVQHTCKYHELEVPTLRLDGTVKLHGTNAAVCTDGMEMWLQTRERILPDDEAHMGFREFSVRNDKTLRLIMAKFMAATGCDDIQVYGEWCGGGIQKGVGLTQLPKMFVIFAVGYGVPPETGHRQWLPTNAIAPILEGALNNVSEIKLSTDFPNYTIEVDFNRPAMSQNTLVDLTIAVETDCPVARQLLGPHHEGELIGEGIVWTAFMPTLGTQRIKVKGEKHSVSRVRTLAPVDEALVKGIEEFVTYAVTENRLGQGIDKLREMGIDPSERKAIGEYVKWVVGDVMREEMGVIASSGLEAKQITGPISRIASAYILKWQSECTFEEEAA